MELTISTWNMDGNNSLRKQKKVLQTPIHHFLFQREIRTSPYTQTDAQ